MSAGDEVGRFAPVPAQRLVRRCCDSIGSAFATQLLWRPAGANYGAPRPYTIGLFADGDLPYPGGIGEGIDAWFERFCAEQDLVATGATLSSTGTFIRTAERDGTWELVVELRQFAFVGVRPVASGGPETAEVDSAS